MERTPDEFGDRYSPELEDASLLTVLTTDHVTLQGARASTVSERSARAAL